MTYEANDNQASGRNQNCHETLYAYDAVSNLATITVGPFSSVTYTYNARDEATAPEGPGGTTSFAYDPGGRLTGTQTPEGSSSLFTYDAAGRVVSLETTTTSGSDTRSLTYDAAGNLLQEDGTRSFLYDGKGRLVEVKEGETTLALMTYDYLDRRTSLTTAQGTTYFHHVGADVVAETDEEGDVTAAYTYGRAGIQSVTRGGETYFYQRNAHGGVVSLTDDTGTVVNTYAYDPWGKLLSATEQVENPYRYAGYRYDQATGLYYLWHRHYDPGVPRFLTPDILAGWRGVPATLNRYAYAFDRPTTLVDPTGLCGEESEGGSIGWHGPVDWFGQFALDRFLDNIGGYWLPVTEVTGIPSYGDVNLWFLLGGGGIIREHKPRGIVEQHLYSGYGLGLPGASINQGLESVEPGYYFQGNFGWWVGGALVWKVTDNGTWHGHWDLVNYETGLTTELGLGGAVYRVY